MSRRALENRWVIRYLVRNHEDPITLNNAIRTIASFLQDNQKLCPTFAIEPDVLGNSLRDRHYLVINGQALSLSRNDRSVEQPAYNDDAFSEDLLESPVRCERGHYLERDRVQFWIHRKGDICPVGVIPHHIVDLTIDREHQGRIGAYRQQRAEQRQADEQDISHLRILEIQLAYLNHRLSALSQLSPALKQSLCSVGGGFSKAIFKLGARKICETLAKKNIISAVTKNTLKAKVIPGVSLVVGIGLGIFRMCRGEYGRAICEVASGGAACLPGWGTAVSVGIDVAIAVTDVRSAMTPTPIIEEADLMNSYRYLGFDTAAIRADDETTQPTRVQVDSAYRQQARALQDPTVIAELGALQGELLRVINASRDSIYQRRNWLVGAQA